MISDEERFDYETERLMRFCCPYGSLDVREAIKFGLEFGINADKIVELAEQFSQDTGILFEELDIVYEHVLQDARNRIYETRGYDFVDDRPSEIYTLGNFMATTYDYTQEARGRLMSKIPGLYKEKRKELLDNYLLRFLTYIDITQEAIEKEAEAQRKADNASEYKGFQKASVLYAAEIKV